jgi:hypothetical protein
MTIFMHLEIHQKNICKIHVLYYGVFIDDSPCKDYGWQCIVFSRGTEEEIMEKFLEFIEKNHEQEIIYTGHDFESWENSRRKYQNISPLHYGRKLHGKISDTFEEDFLYQMKELYNQEVRTSYLR